MATQKLYFKVSRDKYQLPIGVCTRSEIERVLHNQARNVVSGASHYRRKGYGYYRCVEIDEEETEDGEEEK